MAEGARRAELVDIVRHVRRRWRTRLALRGAAIVLGGSVLALLLSATGLQILRFSSPAVIALRVLAFAAFAALAAFWLLGPVMRRVTDTQVALYLEERDPSLEAAILSAVEASAAADPAAQSPALVDRLVESAVEHCRAVDGDSVLRDPIVRRHAATLAAIAGATILILVIGPAYLRQGVTALLVISRGAEAASPYHIEVLPGNASVPRGSDQAVKARLVGFASADAELLLRAAPAAAFERVPLVATKERDTFEGILFHLEKPVEYLVESNGVRSPRYTLSLVDLPAVSKLDLEYHFPAYLNRPVEKVEGTGDVAALRGTEVRVHVVPTMATPSGRLMLNEDTPVTLQRQADGSLTGSFTIDKQGFYRIELEGPHGESVSASPQYTIDALDDMAPSVAFTKPGRDTSATPVEELFLEAKASDDFGLRRLQLVYAVNGGPEKTVTLYGAARSARSAPIEEPDVANPPARSAKTLTEVSAGHTLYLEELGLTPGDFISYYANATDNDGVGGAKTSSSDIYFVKIRPFRTDYKPAQSASMGGGGGNMGEVGALSEQQREIVAATFNLVRDRAKTPPQKYRENLVFLTLAQAKLRQQVDELYQKMTSRQVDHEEGFKKIADALPKASAEMTAAEAQLRGQKAKEALSPEQRALKLLQDAEQEYEVQISVMRGGGGGGGQSNRLAEDLADLFDLELDKLANQYETQQRADQMGADRQIDQIAERLRELARRQQQEIERQRRMASSLASASGGGGNQRALADEVEKTARQLEQLMREQPKADLQDAARRLQQAADAMRRAAANGARDGGAAAASAQERLREAQEQLQRNLSGRGARDVQDAMRQADELASQQKEIASEVRDLEQQDASSRQSRAQKIGEEKDEMTAKLSSLEDELQRLADTTRRDAAGASRKLQEAAGSIRDSKIRDKIRYSKGVLQQGRGGEYAKGFEEEIGANLDALRKKIGEAASALGQGSKQDAMKRALEQARDLARGLDSLDQRMRDRASAAQQAAEASRGQPGETSPSGSQDQAGQPSQDGQSQRSAQGGQQAGQAGSSGQQGAQGQPSANAGQEGQPGGGGAYGGGWADGPWNGWRYNPDDVRQWRGELRRWRNDGQDLRRRFADAGATPRELADFDRVLNELRALDNDRAFTDPGSLEALRTSAIDHLKKFEFDLSRRVDRGSEQLSLSGSDEVPAGFRQAIEEYYRSLARK